MTVMGIFWGFPRESPWSHRHISVTVMCIKLPVFCLTSESELGIRGLMDLMGAFPHKLDLLLAAPIRKRGAIGPPPAVMAHQFV